jgi:hypothetical protein
MYKRILLITLLVIFAAACSGSGEESTPTEALDIEGTVAVIAGTNVAAALTEISIQEGSPATGSAGITATITATLAITPAATDFQSEGVCLSAELVSETPADDAVIMPGQTFEKTWWLRNTGDCAWTEEYSFVFQRGTSMGASERYAFPGYVAPGQAIPFILNFTAPGDAGRHTGFWELESPEGVRFGVGSGSSAPFYVQIVVPGPTSTPRVSIRAPKTWGNIRSDGHVGSDVQIGDSGNNLSFEGFMTFDFGSIPPYASIVYLVLDINQGLLVSGDPFGKLGCLNVYADNYPGAALWRFCSVTDMSAGVVRTGGPDAIAAFENALAAGVIRLTFAFDLATNDDGFRDTILIKVVELRMDFIP